MEERGISYPGIMFVKSLGTCSTSTVRNGSPIPTFSSNKRIDELCPELNKVPSSSMHQLIHYYIVQGHSKAQIKHIKSFTHQCVCLLIVELQCSKLQINFSHARSRRRSKILLLYLFLSKSPSLSSSASASSSSSSSS